MMVDTEIQQRKQSLDSNCRVQFHEAFTHFEKETEEGMSNRQSILERQEEECLALLHELFDEDDDVPKRSESTAGLFFIPWIARAIHCCRSKKEKHPTLDKEWPKYFFFESVYTLTS